MTLAIMLLTLLIGWPAHVASAGSSAVAKPSGAGLLSSNALIYPADPTADIPWSAGTNGVAEIQAAFNHGRTVENNQPRHRCLRLWLEQSRPGSCRLQWGWQG